MKWQMREAKNHLREVVKAANAKGPQTIAVCGEEVAVVVSVAELSRLQTNQSPLGTALWQSAPKVGLLIGRPRDGGRDVGFD